MKLDKECADYYLGTYWNGLDSRMLCQEAVDRLVHLAKMKEALFGLGTLPSNLVGTAKCRHCGTDMKKRERAYLGSVHVYHGVDGEILVEKEPFQGPWQVMDTCDECCKPADSMEGHYLSKKLGTF